MIPPFFIGMHSGRGAIHHPPARLLRVALVQVFLVALLVACENNSTEPLSPAEEYFAEMERIAVSADAKAQDVDFSMNEVKRYEAIAGVFEDFADESERVNATIETAGVHDILISSARDVSAALSRMAAGDESAAETLSTSLEVFKHLCATLLATGDATVSGGTSFDCEFADVLSE